MNWRKTSISKHSEKVETKVNPRPTKTKVNRKVDDENDEESKDENEDENEDESDLQLIKCSESEDQSISDMLRELREAHSKLIKVNLSDDHGLVAVRKPTNQELNHIAGICTPLIEKTQKQLGTVINSSLDTLEETCPELKYVVQGFKEIWDEIEESSDDEDDLDQLDDQERIKIIIERSNQQEKEEENECISQAAKSQKKLSSGASVDTWVEKINCMRRNIIKNAADRETDLEKRQKIISMGNSLDSFQEQIESINIENIIETLIGPPIKSNLISDGPDKDQSSTQISKRTVIIEEIVDVSDSEKSLDDVSENIVIIEETMDTLDSETTTTSDQEDPIPDLSTFQI